MHIECAKPEVTSSKITYYPKTKTIKTVMFLNSLVNSRLSYGCHTCMCMPCHLASENLDLGEFQCLFELFGVALHNQITTK